MADFEQAGASERLRRVAILRDMQAKLKRSPLEALGVVGGASAAEIRSAFMSLTKQYHPAKFARLDEATVKLANEVFLDLREAYEGLQAAALQGGKRARTIPGPGVAEVEATKKPEPFGQASHAPASTASAAARSGQAVRPAEPPRPTVRPADSVTNVPARPGRAITYNDVSPSPSSSRPAGPAGPVTGRAVTPSSSSTSSSAPSPGSTARTSLQPSSSSSSSSSAPAGARPTAGAPAGPPTRPSAPSISTSTSSSAGASTGASASASASSKPSAVPATGSGKVVVPTAASPAPGASGSSSSGVPKVRFGNAEAPELVRIRGLINRQQWGEAREALQAMLQRAPTDRGSMAQLAYVRAREALELGNVSEARRELVRALAIEPTMEQARSALNELNDVNPSKPSSNPSAPRR